MAERRVRRGAPGPAAALATIGWIVTAGAGFAALSMRLASAVPIPVTTFGIGDAAIAGFVVLAVVFATVGVVLVVRRPDNAVGRRLIVVGSAYSLSMLSGVAVFEALAAPVPDREVAALGAWWTVVLSSVGGVAIVDLALIFPTGQPHSERWRRLRRAIIAVSPLYWVWFLTVPGPLHLFNTIENPFGFGPDLRPLIGERALPVLVGIGAMLLGGIPIAAVVGRYRAAGAVERLQLKWFISATVASMASLTLAASAAVFGEAALGEAPLFLYALTSTAVPIAVGVAVLRYRLYDIDRLISRSLAYAIVTAVLAGVYGGVVLALGAVLGSIASGNALAVAVSTLVVVALFGPVRRRAQAAVDRRFDRSRFDARRTLAAMTQTVRNNVEPGRIERDVVTVVAEALHPATIGVWLRPAPVTGSPPRHPARHVRRLSRGP